MAECVVKYWTCLFYFQLILKASSGIDYGEFYTFISTIGAKRLAFLKSLVKNESSTEQNTNTVLTKSNVQDNERTETTQEPSFDSRVFQGAKVSSQPYYLTQNHAVFDITQIQRVVDDMISDPVFRELDHHSFTQPPRDFLDSISETLKNVSS